MGCSSPVNGLFAGNVSMNFHVFDLKVKRYTHSPKHAGAGQCWSPVSEADNQQVDKAAHAYLALPHPSA